METQEYLKQFGRRVRYLRSSSGISQEELAERCNLHRTYIGGVERGERNICLLNILKLANALQVETCQLFEGLS